MWPLSLYAGNHNGFKNPYTPKGASLLPPLMISAKLALIFKKKFTRQQVNPKKLARRN